MNKKHLHSIILFTLVICLFELKANTNTDSLWAIWNNPELPDTLRLNAIHKYTINTHLYSRPDSALYFSLIEYDFAVAKGLKKHEAKALLTKGMALEFTGNPQDALITYQESLAIFQSLGDEQGIAYVLPNMGAVYIFTGENDSALHYFKRSVKIHEKYGDKVNASSGLMNIGLVYYKKGDFKNALKYYRMSLKRTEELGARKRLPNILNNIGIILYEQGKYSEAIDSYTISLKIYEENGNLAMMANSLNNIGLVYSMQGDYKSALNKYYESLKIAGSVGNKNYEARALMNIGTIYQKLGSSREAIDFFERSLKINEEIGYKVDIASCLGSIGNVYIQEGKYKQALEYFNREYDLCEKIGDEDCIAQTLNNLGKLFLRQSKYPQALNYFNKALAIHEETENKRKVAISLNGIGEINFAMGIYNEGIQNSLKSLTISQNINAIKEIEQASFNLYQCYKSIGNFNSALEMLELYLQTRDSLESDDKKKELIRLEFQYEYDKEKQALAFQQEQERLIQAQEVSRLQWIIYGSIGAFVLMMLLAFVIYRNYRGKRRSNALLREQNKEIVRQKQELQELDQFKSRFFANISHELRTPLTLITGPLENLLERPSAEEMDKTLPLVLRNTKKLKSLVNDILDLSKLEKGKIELQESPVQIKAFLNRIWSNYESMAQQLSIEYAISLEHLHSTWVLLDSKRVEKIINNLIFNAIKHTPTGGKIDLMVSQKEDIIVIHVADTGQGIAKEDLPYIFDRYFQSKQPDAPIQGGTGIGLALAHELTYLMGGELTVESELHKGTTFTFTLPLKETDVPAEEIESTVANADGTINPEVEKEEEVLSMPLDQKKHKILIVEDNNDMRHYINGIVKKNHLTTQANHGKEALEILKTTSFDLIITDVMMPEMDGYTLVKHLKGDIQWQGIPVIMLTALDMEDKKLEALTLGVDDYLTKPFSPKELETRINNLLARYKEREKWIAESNHDETEKEPVEDQHQETIINQGKVSKQGLQWLETVRDIILKELENPDFRIVDLADEFHLSERQFLRKFKTLTGLTPKQFQQEVALQKARELLEKGTYHNVSAVAYSVGLQNVSRFSKAYVERFGKNPKAYFA